MTVAWHDCEACLPAVQRTRIRARDTHLRWRSTSRRSATPADRPCSAPWVDSRASKKVPPPPPPAPSGPRAPWALWASRSCRVGAHGSGSKSLLCHVPS